jgi:hypothetical protein
MIGHKAIKAKLFTKSPIIPSKYHHITPPPDDKSAAPPERLFPDLASSVSTAAW